MCKRGFEWSFTLNWPKEVREAVFNLKGGERQLLTRLISSSYLLCRSSSCTRSSPSPASAPPSRGGSRRATPPCPSPSQTRWVGDRYSCIRTSAHREFSAQRILGTQRIGENTKKICLPLLKVSSCCKLTCWWLWFDILQNLLHWMPRRRIGSNER